jgi:lipopolysaccharide export system protein LptA
MMGSINLRSWCGFVVFCSLLLLTGASSAAKDKGKPVDFGADKLVNSDAPLHIASDRMEVKYNEGLILFEGHVVVKQANATITGNRITVYIDTAQRKDGKKTAGEDPSRVNVADRIERIEIEGDVKITQDDKIATADKSVYYHKEQKMVLMGHPTVSQGQDVVKGRLITLYLAEGRSVVEGGDETPVEAVLYPQKKE